ncbi:MAG: tetratricopeptide repeat protein [Desulfobacula sp.]|uniref:tetratricopeptide repeat protein n=1 Tax=Desulfobacula sp. TaxID=2593537 RepID=UPI0025C339F8|nr:tetratricopeptide repeat protein [Desulfobacula sp.]MCD4721255.1 tetratricopeptide repeat protein [Desulfobacula sp.]
MKKSLVYILLIFILSFFLAGCTQLKQSKKPAETRIVQKKEIKKDDNLSANYYYLESRIHIKNKEYQKAAASLIKALAKDPDSFILTRDLCRLYLRQHKGGKALELAEKLVRQNPDNVDGLLLFVQLKKDIMDEKELVEILNKILVLDPNNKETFLRLGKIYMEEKNHSEALILFKKMVVQFPDYYVAWFYLGEVYMAEKLYELAETQFLKTIELEPDLMEPRFQLIKIFSSLNTPNNKKGNNQKILETYKEILEIEPDNHRAQLGTALHYHKTNEKTKAADLFMELGRDVESNSRLVMVAVDEYLSGKKYKDAVIVFSQMLKGDPENSTLNFFAGMAYEAIEDFKKAIFLYLKIRPNHSQYKKTILNIAFLYKKLGEEQTALNYLESKYKTLPKDIDIIIYLSSFYEKNKSYKKAISLLKKGLEDSPENTSLLFRLGAVQDKAGFKQESLSAMKKIIKIDPKDASALNYLGYSYADLGIKLDEALSLIKRAHKLKPDDGYITDSLGWVYYQKGNYKEAVKYLEKAAELTSFETIISDHLGDAYQKANQLEKALNTYKKALSNAKDGDKEKIVELKKKIEAVQKKINE